MKRRKFFEDGVKGAIAAGLISTGTMSCSSGKSAIKAENIEPDQNQKLEEGNPKQWHKMGHGKRHMPDRNRSKTYEVAVIGGGCHFASSKSRLRID